MYFEMLFDESSTLDHAMKILTSDFDRVIQSTFLTGFSDYQYALGYVVPLMDRFHSQRKIIESKFYKKLERDIINGCIMPPLTIAFISENPPSVDGDLESLTQFVVTKISEGFVLDGIQRLNTLRNAQQNDPDKFDPKRPIFYNILISDSMDKLLYRMITLNNGQKPMSARHQIEMLASNVYTFEENDLPFQTEKQRNKRIIRGAFNKADLIKGYLAFLSREINIDNQKIIQSKMDELIADKIMESEVPTKHIEFNQVLDLIQKFSAENQELRKWFKIPNNLIGFCAAISESYDSIASDSISGFENAVMVFEEAFRSIEVSKIRLGLARRKSVMYFFERYDQNKMADPLDITNELSLFV